MNAKKTWRTFLIAAALGATAMSAQASRVAGEIVSGTITSIDPPYRIAVDGHTYAILASGAAAESLGRLVRGQHVDLVLDGPKSSSTSHVISVVTHAGS
jgi:hypothetical protein